MSRGPGKFPDISFRDEGFVDFIWVCFHGFVCAPFAFVLRSLRSHSFDERGGHRQQPYGRFGSCFSESFAHGAMHHLRIVTLSVGSAAILHSIASILMR